MATLPAPHTWTAGDDATSAYLQSLTDSVNFIIAPPRCHAYQSSAQTLANATPTAITFTSESVDTDGIHSTAVNTSRMTIVTAGRYRCIGQVNFTSNATGGRGAQIRLNGSTTSQHVVQAANGTGTLVQVVDEVLCVAGDYIEVYGYQASTGDLDTITGSTATFLKVVWVSTT